MKFDDIFGVIGDFGTFQKVVFVALCLPTIFIAMQNMSPVFILTTPNHRCAIPNLQNDTYEIQNSKHQALIQEYIPGYPDSMSTCDIYNITNQSRDNDTQKIPCHKWVYDKSSRADTVVTELDLVCTKTIYKAHGQTANSVGSLVGLLIMGPISDRYGRRPMYLAQMILVASAAIALVWLPNIYVYLTIRAVGGLGQGLLYATLFIWAMEFIGPSKRVLCGMLVNHFWVLGEFIQTGMAYGLRTWRHLQLAMSIPYIPFLLYFCLVPESPTFLVFNRKPEGRSVIERIAKVNKVTLSEDIFDIDIEETHSRGIKDVLYEIVMMFKDKTLALYSIIFFLNWFVVSLLYYGLTLNVENLHGDMYVNFAISAGMEGIAYTLAIPILSRIGRKKFNCVCMLVGAVALFAMVPLDLYAPESINWIEVAFSMIGKLGASGSYATLYIYSTETFPTVVRNTALGLCAISETVGYFVSPYIVNLGLLIPGSFSKVLPMLVFAVLAIIAGLTTLFLPEFGEDNMPNTLEDMKKKARHNKPQSV